MSIHTLRDACAHEVWGACVCGGTSEMEHRNDWGGVACGATEGGDCLQRLVATSVATRTREWRLFRLERAAMTSDS